jgi:hypothetical protein
VRVDGSCPGDPGRSPDLSPKTSLFRRVSDFMGQEARNPAIYRVS